MTKGGPNDQRGSRGPTDAASLIMADAALDPSLDGLPVLWEVHEIARLVRWSRRRMQRLLARELKIAQKVGGRWLLSTADLREAFPPAYRELARRWEAGDLPKCKRGGRRGPKAAAEGQDDRGAGHS